MRWIQSVLAPFGNAGAIRNVEVELEARAAMTAAVDALCARLAAAAQPGLAPAVLARPVAARAAGATMERVAA